MTLPWATCWKTCNGRGCLCVLGLAAAHPWKLHHPRAVSGPRRTQPGHSVTPHQPPKVQPRGATVPRQELGPSPVSGACSAYVGQLYPPFWFSLPWFSLSHAAWEGRAELLRSLPQLGSSGTGLSPWQLLEVASSGVTFHERCFLTHNVLVALFIWHREAPSPSVPHGTAPFPTLGGWNMVLPLPAPRAHSQRRGGQRMQLPSLCWVGPVTGDNVSCPQWRRVRGTAQLAEHLEVLAPEGQSLQHLCAKGWGT